MSFWIEESNNNRAECKICFKTIRKGEIRVFGDLGSGRYGYYYHLECFLRRCNVFVPDVLKYVFPYYFKDNKEAISLINRLSEIEKARQIAKCIGRKE